MVLNKKFLESKNINKNYENFFFHYIKTLTLTQYLNCDIAK